MATFSDIELVAALHAQPDAPSEADVGADRQASLIFTIFVVAALCGTYQNVVFNIIKTVYFQNYRDNRKMFLKTAYQITNMTVNLCLGVYGIYYHFYSVPAIDSVSIAVRIAGFHDYSIFGALQVGYNLWALPIGYFFMDESPAMLAHHIAVMCVGSISCFGANGFRYHAPFFFGLVEISSVPLSIMNFCKSNPEIVNMKFPKLLGQIRIVFVIVFITVRVFMWIPLISDVLWSAALLGGTCDTNLCRIGVGSFWSCGFFLTLLQLYWASLIVKGVAQMLNKKDGNKPKAE
eukprot:scaffold6248_cov251-Chaetoceros_neogracile.AAC.9